MLRYLKSLAICLSKIERVPSKPIYIQLEPTNNCNLRCKMCARADLIKKPGNMKLHEFIQIIDTIQPRKLALSGLGEPFTNRELLSMVSYAKQKGISVNTCTNGTLVESISAEVVQSGLDLLKVSIDAATPETYMAIRGEDRFDKVINGVKSILDYKREHNIKKPHIRFQYILQQSNIEEPYKILELAAHLGVEAVFFQPLEEKNIEHLMGDLVVEYTEIVSALKKAQVTAKQLRIDTNLDMLLRKPIHYWHNYSKDDLIKINRRWKRQTCLFPWFSAYITLEGDLRPCCLFAMEKEANMGNIFDESFDSIWNSKKYQNFRNAISSGSSPFKRCETCVPPSYFDMLKLRKVLPGFLALNNKSL